MKEVLISKIVDALIKHCVGTDSTAVATRARQIADADAYAIVEDTLTPVNRDAIRHLREQGVPMAFIRGVSEEAASKIANPLQRVQAIFAGQGSSFDAQVNAEINAAARGTDTL